MNTLVPYHRPQHRNKYGRYISRNIIQAKCFINFTVKIKLVWFNHAGWYYIVDVDACKEKEDGSKSRWEFIFDGVTSIGEQKWPRGIQLSDCASAAENAAVKLLANHGITINPESLQPYVLGRY